MNNQSNGELDFLVNAFDSMSLNDKRNEFNSLLYKTNEILNQVLLLNGMENVFPIKNYDSNNDNKMSEEEIMTFLYEDLYKVKTNAVLLLTLIASNKSQNADNYQ